MEAFTIDLPKAALRAVAKFAALQDIRFYMCGVCIEVVAKNEARIVATDGYTIAVYRLITPVSIEKASVILPIERVLAIAKLRRDDIKAARKGYVTLSVEATAPKARPFASITDGEITTRFPLIDGVFPDYRKALSVKKPSGNGASFQVRFIARLHAAAEMIDGKDRYGCGYIISHNDDNPALARIKDPNFLACLMPIRNRLEPLAATPEWIGVAEEKPATKKQTEAVPA